MAELRRGAEAQWGGCPGRPRPRARAVPSAIAAALPPVSLAGPPYCYWVKQVSNSALDSAEAAAAKGRREAHEEPIVQKAVAAAKN